jgi:hypothetical protein
VSFHLIALEQGPDAEVAERLFASLEDVEEGETVFIADALTTTPDGTSEVFLRVVKAARQRRINIVGAMNVGGDLVADLPGADPMERYQAVVIFTRYGSFHVPQARTTPHPYQLDEPADGDGAVIVPYRRWNVVPLELDDEVVQVRFAFGPDLAGLMRHSPSELACDLVVVLGALPSGAEKVARRLLGRALAEGMAETALIINGYSGARVGDQAPAVRAEDVLDAQPASNPRKSWKSERSLRSAFWVYDDLTLDEPALAAATERRGRIPVWRSAWDADLALGKYPVMIGM